MACYLDFCCSIFKYDADLNAAINIKQNYILSLTNKEQAVVNQPNVTDIN